MTRSRMLSSGLNRGVLLCLALFMLGFFSIGCAKVRKIEGGSWTIDGTRGHVFIADGKYWFGPKKKDPKETRVTEYSKNACYFKFRLINQTDRSLQIKTMGELRDKSGNILETVMTNYYKQLDPDEEQLIEGFFGVTRKDVVETVKFVATVDDAHIR